MNIFKKFFLLAVITAVAGCADLLPDDVSGDINNDLGCDITMFDIKLDEREMDSIVIIENAIVCNGSSNAQVSFSGENAKYFLVNDQSELSYNFNNLVNHDNFLNLTFSTSPEAQDITGTITATIVLKVSNYVTMKKFEQEYTITRIK